MIRAAVCFAVVLYVLSLPARACAVVEGPAPTAAASLSLSKPSFSVSDSESQPKVSSFATLTNSSGACFEAIIIEVKYYDANNVLVDSTTRSAFGVIAPPGQSVAIRIRDDAAMPKRAYASQVMRVVHAELRPALPEPTLLPPFYRDALLFGGVLFALVVFLYFALRIIKSMTGMLSRYSQDHSVGRQQLALMATHNALLERLVAAGETISRTHQNSDQTSD